MFPGDQYLRQEKRRAEYDGQAEERRRVLRLIDNRVSAIDHARKEVEGSGKSIDVQFIVNQLEELRRAVQQGHQR